VVEAGAERLGVVTVAEGIKLREAGIKVPILNMGPTMREEIDKIYEYNITPSVFSWELATAISEFSIKQNITIKIHIKIDTGMGRLGILYTQAFEFIKKVYEMPGIEIEGVFSHLASSDSINKAYAYEQFRRFEGIINRLKRIGIDIPYTHIANSGAIIDLPEMKLNIVRPGISIYGIFPSKSVSQRVSLSPAMSFKTRIIYLKDMPRDLPVHGFLPVYSGISYGRTYVKKKMRIATLPVGYADGYPRALSNKAEVLIHGQRAPIVGMVTMNFCMIDVTHIPNVCVGDEVILFGEELKVDELAEICGTISYEILCGINPDIPRVYK
jgi:alanine racemase